MGYCEAKAADFIAKQRDWGWQCELMEAEVQGPASETPRSGTVTPDTTTNKPQTLEC